MADWATISSLATAGGTLVLAVATFASVRSANRSARVAEVALQEQRRPLLMQSRATDPPETVPFAGDHWMTVAGGGAAVDAFAEAVFLGLSVRNVGAGIAVLQGWYPHPTRATSREPPPEVDQFRPLLRDQYVASGDTGLWQGSVRDPTDPLHAALTDAATKRQSFSVDLLYSDQVGGQRTISRFGFLPGEDGTWVGGAARHWYLDAISPR